MLPYLVPLVTIIFLSMVELGSISRTLRVVLPAEVQVNVTDAAVTTLLGTLREWRGGSKSRAVASKSPGEAPAAPRHGPGGPWQRTARQFARYGPGWRGGSSAGQPPKHPRWTLAMGARAGSPRRTALISAFSRDGTGQPVVGTDSSKKGAFRKARAPPRQRSARPVCSTR